ncbi:MAG: phosphoribosyltransferase [Vicinamibacterales bacterium]
MSTFAVPRVPYADRREAGVVLAGRLRDFAGRADVVVLGLPRGGIPVAFEVATALEAPLDVFVVRKLGLPGHPELAMGAIASGGVRVLNDDLLQQLAVPVSVIDAVTRAERIELERRERAYRGARPAIPLEGRIVIIVDDGLATGATMRAAVLAIRRLLPSQIVVAVPVGARDTCRVLNELADEVVCAAMPEPFTAVGAWYDNFAQTTDEEVRRLLVPPAAGIDARRSA